MKTLCHSRAAALFVLLLALPASAQPRRTLGGVPPAVLQEVGIDERLGQPLDLRLPFTDMGGHSVRLANYFSDGKPVLLVLAYYRCAMLCGLVLRGAVDGLRDLGWTPGDRFRALTVSFDPRDTPAMAAQKRVGALSALRLPEDTQEWPFLVGESKDARALADGLGFRVAYDAPTDQYAHPAALFVLTPEGRISRVLYGIQFSAHDLRLALLEAADGKTGTIVDRVIMTCYRYDPSSRRYAPFIVGFLRIGGLAILLTVGMTLAVLFRATRRRRLEPGSGDTHQRPSS